MLAFVAFLGVILVGSGSCWHFDGDCNVKCFGLDCILGKPTNAEVCELGKNFGVFRYNWKLAKKNMYISRKVILFQYYLFVYWIRSKCCGAEPNSEVGTLNLFGKIARDINQFQEQLQMRFEPGWYFNQSCSMSCRLFSCFFKPKPSKAELCQTTMNKYK